MDVYSTDGKMKIKIALAKLIEQIRLQRWEKELNLPTSQDRNNLLNELAFTLFHLAAQCGAEGMVFLPLGML